MFNMGIPSWLRKLKGLVSTGAQIDAIVALMKGNISNIPFLTPNMTKPETWSKAKSAQIIGNKVTLVRHGTLTTDQSKTYVDSNVVSGQKYLLLANLEKINILNAAITQLTFYNYSQIISSISIADHINSGKRILAIPFTATVNGTILQIIANNIAEINLLDKNTPLIEFNTSFMGVLPWTQALEDYWSLISSNWLYDDFSDLLVAKAIKAKIADYALDAKLPESSFTTIKTSANRILDTYNNRIVTYNSVSNSISNFFNITNSVFNCGGVVDLTAQPLGRLWFGLDIQPSNYLTAAKSYVLVMVGTGIFKNVKYLSYGKATGGSVYIVQNPADNAVVNIKAMVELNYAQAENSNSRYSYLIPTRLNAAPATLEYSCAFTTFALFEKIEGFSIDDYIEAANKTVIIPKYKTPGLALESYVNNTISTSINSSSLGLNSNTFNPKYDVEMLLSGGQSLNVGGGAASAANDFKNTLSFAKGSGLYNKAFTTESDKTAFFGTDLTPIVKAEESYPPITASTISILRLLEQENRLDINNFGSSFMPFAWGSSGTSITTQNKGNIAYSNMIEVVTKANEYTVKKGKTFAVRTMNWYHGEADKSQTKEWYYNHLATLFTDINNDIKLITGQTEDIEFFTYQTAGWADKYMGIQEAQLQLSTERANVHMAGAMYQFTYSDSFHPVDRAVIGLQTGIAIKRVVYDNLGWRDFKPISHKVITNNGKYYIHLKFDVPVKPLRFDTTGNVWHNPRGKQTNYGFEVIGGGIEKQIAEPFVTRGDTVVLTTSENPVGMIIKYAVTGHDGGGNLCDSQNISIKNKNIDYIVDNFAVSFSNYIIS